MIEVIHKNIENYCDNIHVLALEPVLKSRSNNYGWFVSDKFILPYFIDKKLIFKKLVFSTGCVKRDPNATVEDEKAFLNEVVEHSKKNIDADFIAKAQSAAVFNACPDGADCVPWGTMIVDLDKREEELFKSFESKCRNIIRKSIKLGTTVEETDNIEEVYEVMKDTFVRQNSPYIASLNFFKKLHKSFKDNMKLYIAKNDGKIQGVTIVAFDKDTAYYWYSGSAANPVPGSVNMLQHEIMKDMQKMGIKYYDMVGVRLNVKQGTKQAAIRRFKERFKPELVEGYAFRIVLKPFKFFLHNIAIKLYFKFKGMEYVDPIDQIRYNKYD